MTRRASHGGFTLIEVIIAAMVLAVLAAIVLPRLNRSSPQVYESTVERIVALMSTFATREATGIQQVAMLQDPETGEIGLSIMQRILGEGSDSRASEWIPDPLTQPFRLPRGVEIADVIVDSDSIGGTDWMVASIPGGGRPRVEIRVVADGMDTVIILEPSSIAPVRIDSERPAPPIREAIDLEGSGRAREFW
ncbi:MAG: prepilin-type N-terminal cleavage/methylation domain-containing protein [Phycisphaerales bacterium]|nr:prepilin-type N-terminal cleavage/methylation domain-containing protein [Phycisphaerales bacterium]